MNVRKKRVSLMICICLLTTLGISQDNNQLEFRHSLDGHWELYIYEWHESLIGTVPGTVHTDLLANKRIPDPYKDYNADSLAYLESMPFLYRTTFEIETDKSYSYDLIAEGIDTYSEVLLNGVSLGKTDNMFRTWEYVISDLLKDGQNTLEVRITPPIKYHEETLEELSFIYPADNDSGNPRLSPLCRKAAYQFGWDWCPRLVTCGIWRPIYISRWKDFKVTSSSVNTKSIEEDEALMELDLYVYAAEEIEVDLALGDFIKTTKTLRKGSNHLTIPFTIENPQLWWTHDSGSSFLYKEQLTIGLSDYVYHEDVNWGVRTIELINERDSIGTAFYFKLNGQPVFMQGANYIPQDMLTTRVTDADYRDLLQDAQDAHMNMLRVWGGGIYERDLFYDLCDSLGILVWQDFMFANTVYPSDAAFIENVSAEVSQQVHRLKRHPCIATWCGNNEINVAWHNWGWQDKYDYSAELQRELYNGYRLLFEKVIPQLVKNIDPYSNYTSTSPLSNWGTAANFNHSSMHYWGVWHGKDDLEQYAENVGRFMVEYGFQSYPAIETINEFSDHRITDLDDPILQYRQRSYIGNQEISRQIARYETPANDLDSFINQSQSLQAKGMQIAINAHKYSNGHCMGTLLWQLNDCWPGISWSLIDYYGRKKEAYDVVKEEFGKE